MGTLHHMPQPTSAAVGAKLTKTALGIRFGRDEGWVTRQGVRVRGKTDLGLETWEASYKPGGRLASYTLLTLQDPDEQTKGAQICAG
jgi:hypothetical protein